MRLSATSTIREIIMRNHWLLVLKKTPRLAEKMLKVLSALGHLFDILRHRNTVFIIINIIIIIIPP